MGKLHLQLHDDIAVDTLTGETIQKAVYIESGMRRIYIGIETLAQINAFLKENGIKLPEV